MGKIKHLRHTKKTGKRRKDGVSQTYWKGKKKGEITKKTERGRWEYDKYGGVTLKTPTGESRYLQVDTDVEAFFDSIGEDTPEYAPAHGYFTLPSMWID